MMEKNYDGYYLFEPEIGDIIEGTINKTNKDKDKIRLDKIKIKLPEDSF
jgi:hypothetical protein